MTLIRMLSLVGDYCSFDLAVDTKIYETTDE